LIWLLILAASMIAVAFFVTCSGGSASSGDDDTAASEEDKETVLCSKIEACQFENALGITDCVTYAKDISGWLLDCAMKAEGCEELADCFNLNQ
jgi:hypothetical protein